MRVPLFAIQARDDPIVNDLAVPYKEIEHNKYVVMVATSGGGHLSWFQPDGNRWFARTAAAWLNTMANKVDFDKLRRDKSVSTLANGEHDVETSKP